MPSDPELDVPPELMEAWERHPEIVNLPLGFVNARTAGRVRLLSARAPSIGRQVLDSVDWISGEPRVGTSSAGGSGDWSASAEPPDSRRHHDHMLVIATVLSRFNALR